MSSGEEFEVDEILAQRRRKGVVEYLVRWQGFNQLYDSWEPASGIAHCAKAIKAFTKSQKEQQSKSRSRSRSRGRKPTKSRSRSAGRKPKTAARSRSRSASRKAAVTSGKTSKVSAAVKITKKEDSPAQPRKLKIQEVEEVDGERTSTRRAEVVTRASRSRVQGGILKETSQVVKNYMETDGSTPLRTSSSMTTRSRLAVRQVDNDERAPDSGSKLSGQGWWERWWGFADHAVLVLFIIVSIIALSFTVEALSDIREKLMPDFSVLRHRLAESYAHAVEAIGYGFNNVLQVLPSFGEEPTTPSTPAPPVSPKSTAA